MTDNSFLFLSNSLVIYSYLFLHFKAVIAVIKPETFFFLSAFITDIINFPFLYSICETMKNLLEMDVLSPTEPDNLKNRLKEFMMYGTAQFMQTAATEILNSLDKNNIKAKKYSKYLTKFVGLGATGLSFAGGLGPVSKGIGSATGTMTEELINQIVKKKKHKQSKTIAKYLEGFDPESEIWIKFVLDCFADLFIK